MSKKLTKDEAAKKRDFHRKRAKYYDKKYIECKAKEKRIGFKWYD